MSRRDLDNLFFVDLPGGHHEGLNFSATSDEDGLIQALREPGKSFKKEIRQTAPDFRPLLAPRNLKSCIKQPERPPAPSFLKDEKEERHQTSSGDAVYIEERQERRQLHYISARSQLLKYIQEPL